MEEIVKHINDTNASYRALNAGDAKNTDLFLDNEHYEMFKDAGERITVRFNKENLQKAILFIATILPRKYDNSSTHKKIPFSSAFVLDQLAFLDYYFTIDGKEVETRTQVWNARKDVEKKNGEIDNRFYFNGLLEDVTYLSFDGEFKTAKFTIRNYVAGGYSDLHIKKADDGVFDVWVTNVLEPYYDGKEKGYEQIDVSHQSLQQIFYGAPGTGKSHCIKDLTKNNDNIVRTTFHPDSDYSTFVGAYKPTTKQVPMRDVTGKVIKENGQDVTEDRIIYEFVNQAFLQAYINAWKLYAQCTEGEPEKQYLVIEEINRGNCAQIFGDLFQLLDRNHAGFSEYPIKADADMKNQLAKAFNGIDILDKESINQYFNGKDVVEKVLKGEELVLPNNLYIWATMNTSDQSLFPIDSAFKRRWDWQYMPITNGKKDWKIEVNGLRYDWWDFLEKMNEQINATTNSEDKKMGYFFCKPKNGIIDASTFVGKVVFYVWNDVFKDFANEAGNLFIDEDGTLLTFSKFYRVVNGKTEVLEDKVERLLNNLGVVAEGGTIDVEEFEKDVPANSSKNYLKEIVFPDGTIYSTSEMTHFDAYMAAIRKIGVERVASVADKLKYRRLNRPLISAEKYEEIENSAGFSYQQEGNYYFVKGVMTYTLVRILEDLDELLNVGMTINN